MTLGPLKRARISLFQLLMLIQLSSEPKYGYEILKELKEHFGSTWNPKTGTIYPALRSLEGRGFIKTSRKEDKEFYVLTNKGKSVMNGLLNNIEKEISFSNKYFEFVNQKLSVSMKEKVIDIINKMIKENILLMGIMNIFSDDELDKKIRLNALYGLKNILEERLDHVNNMIVKLEGDSYELHC
ncbi:PadR family transcriptional regulator [Candidatus Bathyarchaeota archaeon]|nr:PadR family transcriptional regulator [Candidatus Bathyarchaeota archaeon]MBS7630296.1 PadR family transcriptional regulator [Candidatus Bathyarchaeota archaeon]